MTDPLENMRAVKRGGEGLAIGERYPVAEYGGPNFEAEGATWQELDQAGFDRPAEAEPVVVDDDGEEHPVHFFVLRDEAGQIVATWDEGRWWTPQESEAFLAAMLDPAMRMLAEATAEFGDLNREQRRKKKGK